MNESSEPSNVGDMPTKDVTLHRIEFARETLRGNQQLIQLLDQKS